MALEIGTYNATIIRHCLDVVADKTVARITVETEYGDRVDVLVFFTTAAYGIARASLRKCGFDVDANDLAMLDDDPTLLAGHRVPILVEDYNGRLRAQVVLGGKPSSSELSKIQSGLRAAKKGNEPAQESLPAKDVDDALPF